MLKTLLRSDVAERIGRLYKSGVAPTAKQREEFAAARKARPKLAAAIAGARPMAADDPENYAVIGSVAQICMEGVLSEEPDFWAWLFGMDGTTYEDIRDAFALAAADPLVKSVVLDVCSPGGYTDGLFDTLAVIEAFGKPITVQSSQACSAAYALAAMAGRIEPKGPASEFGSIGVACSFCFDADEEVIDVTSTEAPDKRPDPRTPEGKAVIVAQLDAIHDLFVDAIARGRTNATGTKYTTAQVNASFGRGTTMLADAAYAAGLIDKKPKKSKRGSSAEAEEGDETPNNAPIVALVTTAPAPVAIDTAHVQTSAPRSPGQEKEKTRMTKEELKAAHPALYTELVAEGRVEGAASERKRVNALLKMGKSCAAQDIADKAIAEGKSVMDEDVFADFQTAAINRRDTANRQADSDTAGAIVAQAKTGSGAPAGAPGAAPPAAVSADGEDTELMVAAANIYAGKKA